MKWGDTKKAELFEQSSNRRKHTILNVEQLDSDKVKAGFFKIYREWG